MKATLINTRSVVTRVGIGFAASNVAVFWLFNDRPMGANDIWLLLGITGGMMFFAGFMSAAINYERRRRTPAP